MNSVNFNQLLCRNASTNGENISGIFDTLFCEKGANTIFICVLCSQILNDVSNKYDRYYYRIVLRHFGNTRDEMTNYRVDSGVFWEEEHNNDEPSEETTYSRHKTTRPGSSGTLVIEFEHDFETQGSYEVDLYIKKLEEDETYDDCERLTVKALEIVSICPFQVIFPNS